MCVSVVLLWNQRKLWKLQLGNIILASGIRGHIYECYDIPLFHVTILMLCSSVTLFGEAYSWQRSFKELIREFLQVKTFHHQRSQSRNWRNHFVKYSELHSQPHLIHGFAWGHRKYPMTDGELWMTLSKRGVFFIQEYFWSFQKTKHQNHQPGSSKIWSGHLLHESVSTLYGTGAYRTQLINTVTTLQGSALACVNTPKRRTYPRPFLFRHSVNKTLIFLRTYKLHVCLMFAYLELSWLRTI